MFYNIIFVSYIVCHRQKSIMVTSQRSTMATRSKVNHDDKVKLCSQFCKWRIQKVREELENFEYITSIIETHWIQSCKLQI